MGSDKVVPSNRTANSATIGLGTQHPNGLYHCLTAQSQREYFSLFLRNSGEQMCDYETKLIKIPLGCEPHSQGYVQTTKKGKTCYKLNLNMYMFDCKVFIPLVTSQTPTVSGRDNSTWTLTSPDGSHVEIYIVEFECRVRNITFVEKYMSVYASGGTGRVATSLACFGGLGQLYRVKVWAVSGPSISRALVCVTGGQCREEGRRATMHVANMLCMFIRMHYTYIALQVHTIYVRIWNYVQVFTKVMPSIPAIQRDLQ